MRQQSMTSALNAGTLAVNAFNAQKDIRPMSSKTADVMAQIRSGKPMSGIDTSDAFTYEGKLPTDMAQDAVNNALKYIDSTAAAGAGAPPPDLSTIDIPTAIGRNAYFPGGAPGPAAGGASGMPAWLTGGAPPPPQPAPAPPVAPAAPMVSSGAVGPWANGGMPAPGTTWQNPDYVPGIYSPLA